jgi:hypothetical protein
MNVKIGTNWEYINGIFLAVYHRLLLTKTYRKKGLFCSFRFREIVPLRDDVHQVRGESGDAGLVQLFDRLQSPAAHRQRVHQLPHLLLTQVQLVAHRMGHKGFIPVEDLAA